MKNGSTIAVVLFSACGMASAAVLEQSEVLAGAGIAPAAIELRSPAAPQKVLISLSPKIKVNEAQFNAADTVVLTIGRQGDVARALKFLESAGYKVKAGANEAGGRQVIAEIRDTEARAKALDLAGYDFVSEVLLNQAAYSALAYEEAPKSAGFGLGMVIKRKIKLLEAQPDMNDTLIGLIKHGEDIDKVVGDLAEVGLKAEAYQDNLGGYMVMIDVKGLDAPAAAITLARYGYVAEVQVGRKVYSFFFAK
jgi:hypothetical protein